MEQSDGEYRKTFESEKSRTVVLLGFLSMILTARAILKDGDFWNFPWWCDNSCPHLTLLLVPTFTYWIYLWSIYIVCMLIYFSEDKFDRPGSWFTRTRREFLRRAGHLSIWWYPVTVIFFSGFGGLSFQLPDSVQGAYWVTVASLFGYYVVRTAEETVGKKALGKESVFNKPLDTLLEYGRAGTEAIGELLAHGSKRISPRRATQVFIFSIEAVVVSIAYFTEPFPGINLTLAFLVPLYVFVFVAGFVGWLKKRRQRKESKGTTDSFGT